MLDVPLAAFRALSPPSAVPPTLLPKLLARESLSDRVERGDRASRTSAGALAACGRSVLLAGAVTWLTAAAAAAAAAAVTAAGAAVPVAAVVAVVVFDDADDAGDAFIMGEDGASSDGPDTTVDT